MKKKKKKNCSVVLDFVQRFTFFLKPLFGVNISFRCDREVVKRQLYRLSVKVILRTEMTLAYFNPRVDSTPTHR